jgi:hypothetical protein
MNIIPLVVTLVATLALPSAQAQPYKCTVDGKTVYQQARCAGGTAVNVSGAGRGDPGSPVAAQLQREVAAIRRRDAGEAAIRAGEVFIGMTADEVVKSWGQPSKINSSTSVGGLNEQWIYRSKRIGYDQYVYLDNGIVTGTQSSQ